MSLENNNQQLDRMNWLIQSLLKLAKLDAGAIQFVKDRRSLNWTVQESVDMLCGIAEQKGVNVQIKKEHELMMEHDKDWLT